MLNKSNFYHSFILVGFLLSALFTWGCDDGYSGVDYRQLEEDEKTLLGEFYASAMDTLVSQSKDTLDFRETTGLMFFEIEKGDGEIIGSGVEVSFRYKYYQLEMDEETGEAVLYDGGWSNYDSDYPVTYTTGNTGDGIYEGLDQGIRNMRLNGKAKMVIPSFIGTGDFNTLFAEVEVTAVELDYYD
ncbi:hypothetical protein QA597_06545 [Marinilabiliaceae bacterium ANBcel2]|nr:hypothetical protein [Marinilabiliaceae bacterium ANBcel2]